MPIFHYKMGEPGAKLVSPNNLTSDTSNPEWELSADTTFSGDYPMWKAFDGKPGGYLDGWLSAEIGGDHWIAIRHIGSPITVSEYGFFPAWSGGNDAPRTWQFQGSTNGSTWVTLDSQSNIDVPTESKEYKFKLAAPATYEYFRLYVTANQGGHSYLAIGEITLYGSALYPTSTGFDDMGFAVPYDMASDAGCSLVVASNVIVTPYDATQDVYGDWIISSLTVLNSTHRPWKAFGDPEISSGHEWHSAWRGSLSYDNPEWIQWQNLKYLIKIKEYTIINRTADCGILDWELQGSNDGNTWTTLDKVSRPTALPGEALTRQVSQDKQGEYSYHRIFITKADNSYVAIGYITASGDITKELEL